MALTDKYPIRGGIIATRLFVWDPCTRKATLGAKKGYVTQAIADIGYSREYSDEKTIDIPSADPFRVRNGLWRFPPLLKGATVDLQFSPDITEAEIMYNPGASITRSGNVTGWVDYVGPMSSLIGIEAWRYLNWGPDCTITSDQYERECYIAGYPKEGDKKWSTGDKEAETTSLKFELQPFVPAAPKVLTGSTTTSGSPNVTVTSSAELSVGMLVVGTGIPANARILTVTDATHVALTANASASGTVSLTFSYAGPFGDWPTEVCTQMDAANAASKETFRIRFSESALPATLTGAGFITIT